MTGSPTRHTNSSANRSFGDALYGGVVASVNYVSGPWTFRRVLSACHGRQPHPAPPAATTVDIAELGLSCLIDKNHNLLGMGNYTDVKLFASVYYYRFRGRAVFLMSKPIKTGRYSSSVAAFSFF